MHTADYFVYKPRIIIVLVNFLIKSPLEFLSKVPSDSHPQFWRHPTLHGVCCSCGGIPTTELPCFFASRSYFAWVYSTFEDPPCFPFPGVPINNQRGHRESNLYFFQPPSLKKKQCVVKDRGKANVTDLEVTVFVEEENKHLKTNRLQRAWSASGGRPRGCCAALPTRRFRQV